MTTQNGTSAEDDGAATSSSSSPSRSTLLASVGGGVDADEDRRISMTPVAAAAASNNNPNAKMSPSYALGLAFIALVSVIWAGSSVLTQYLYQDRSFRSPFLLTYIGVSLFTLWLPTHALCFSSDDQDGRKIRGGCCIDISAATAAGDSTTATGGEYRALSNPATTSDEDGDDANENGAGATSTATNSATVPLSSPQAPPTSAFNHHRQLSHRSPTIHSGVNGEEEGGGERRPTSSGIPPFEMSDDSHHHSSSLNYQQSNQQHWTHEDHFKAALQIAPIWFLANWTYNASLEYTSITSSTVLASTGSLFTFVFAIASRNENFSYLKLSGVLFGVCGSIFTTLSDRDEEGDKYSNTNSLPVQHRALLRVLFLSPPDSLTSSGEGGSMSSLWGDCLGLISAVGYGAYAVLTRVLCPHDESLYSMQILLGYIGLICMISLSPVAIWELVFAKSDDVDSSLTWVVFGFLVVKGLFDNVLSDYLWLRAVILTSATVATVGLGLTIPLAFLSDVVMGTEGVVSFASVLGAVSILVGFVLVNIGNEEEVDRGAATSGESIEVAPLADDENLQPMEAQPPYRDDDCRDDERQFG